MEEKQGVVENISEKNKGLKIIGIGWLDVEGEATKFLSGMLKGRIINYHLNEQGKVIYINPIREPPQEPKQELKQDPKPEQHRDSLQKTFFFRLWTEDPTNPNSNKKKAEEIDKTINEFQKGKFILGTYQDVYVVNELPYLIVVVCYLESDPK